MKVSGNLHPVCLQLYAYNFMPMPTFPKLPLPNTLMKLKSCRLILSRRLRSEVPRGDRSPGGSEMHSWSMPSPERTSFNASGSSGIGDGEQRSICPLLFSCLLGDSVIEGCKDE